MNELLEHPLFSGISKQDFESTLTPHIKSVMDVYNQCCSAAEWRARAKRNLDLPKRPEDYRPSSRYDKSLISSKKSELNEESVKTLRELYDVYYSLEHSNDNAGSNRYPSPQRR